MKHTTNSVKLVVGVGLAVLLILGAWVMSSANVAQAAPAGQSAGEYITVIVKPGDYLGRYARVYGVTGAALMAANKQLLNGNLIYPGQVITIPVIKSYTPSLTTPFYYVVQTGDTLDALGKRFEMNPRVIASVNGIADSKVVVGATLLIPAGPHEHIAQAGETIKSIAAFYGLSVQFILSSNILPNPDVIYAGQTIYISIVYNGKPVALTGSGTPMPTLNPTAIAAATGAPQPGATAAPATAAPPVSGNYIQLTVRSGESLVTYIYRYGITGGLIRSANPQLKDPNLLYPGDVITIPYPVSFTPSRTTPFFYVVAGGDTSASIAAKFEMSQNVLTSHNPGASFAAGTTILLPAGPHVYTVQFGDDLKGIAAKYGTTVSVLLSGNQLPDPDRIYPNQLIFIPIQYNVRPLGYN